MRGVAATGTGVPRPVERALMRRYGTTTVGRMKIAGLMRALAVLLRRHPKAALEMAGAGVLQASRVGVQDLTLRLSRYEREAAPEPRPGRPISPAELRRFARFLDRQGRSR